MNDSPHRRTTKGLLKTCSACGGDWFREATYYAFLMENSNPACPNWPDLAGQASFTPMTVGVCLCGMPLEPLIGAERGGTAGRELTQFLESLQKGRKSIRENQDGNPVVVAAKEQLATIENLKALDNRLIILQQEVGRRQRGGPGRYWQWPTRQAASGTNGTLTRDRLALILQKNDVSFRDARKVVKEILDSMIRSLDRGDSVDVPPLGKFFVKTRPPQRPRPRFGRIQTLFRQHTKVAFQPTAALRKFLKKCGNSPLAEAIAGWKDGKYHCEKCGSTMFAEGEFRQYTQMPSSIPGGDLQAITEGLPIRATICICGHPRCLERVSRHIRGDRASFEKSIQMAIRHRETADPEAIADRLAAVFAGNAQQIALAERISYMEKIVQDLQRPNIDLSMRPPYTKGKNAKRIGSGSKQKATPKKGGDGQEGN